MDCHQVVDIIKPLLVTREGDAFETTGRPFLERYIAEQRTKGSALEFVLLGFPHKNPDPRVSLGSDADAAEVFALIACHRFCTEIGALYPLGCTLTIVSDGRVWAPLTGVARAVHERYARSVARISAAIHALGLARPSGGQRLSMLVRAAFSDEASPGATVAAAGGPQARSDGGAGPSPVRVISLHELLGAGAGGVDVDVGAVLETDYLQGQPGANDCEGKEDGERTGAETRAPAGEARLCSAAGRAVLSRRLAALDSPLVGKFAHFRKLACAQLAGAGPGAATSLEAREEDLALAMLLRSEAYAGFAARRFAGQPLLSVHQAPNAAGKYSLRFWPAGAGAGAAQSDAPAPWADFALAPYHCAAIIEPGAGGESGGGAGGEAKAEVAGHPACYPLPRQRAEALLAAHVQATTALPATSPTTATLSRAAGDAAALEAVLAARLARAVPPYRVVGPGGEGGGEEGGEEGGGEGEEAPERELRRYLRRGFCLLPQEPS